MARERTGKEKARFEKKKRRKRKKSFFHCCLFCLCPGYILPHPDPQTALQEDIGIIITITITRSCAAIRAADLDWIVGPEYSSGRYMLGCSQHLDLCLRHSARTDILFRTFFVLFLDDIMLRRENLPPDAKISPMKLKISPQTLKISPQT